MPPHGPICGMVYETPGRWATGASSRIPFSRDVPAKEIAAIMSSTSRAAAELIACLTRLRNTGIDLKTLLPTDETIRHDDEESRVSEPGGQYADARFFISMKLPPLIDL
jgi:hypothetical protein